MMELSVNGIRARLILRGHTEFTKHRDGLTTRVKSWTFSILSFAATVALAVWQDWRAVDIAWSMWFTSLTTGYLFILCTIFGRPAHADARSSATAGMGPKIRDLIFFTFHFGFFHFVHSQILWNFLPLGDEKPTIDGLLLECARRFWPFVVIATLNLLPRLAQQWQAGSTLGFDEPYKAVVRNHIMILALAVVAELGGGSLLLYLMLAVYFVPFDRLRSLTTRASR